MRGGRNDTIGEARQHIARIHDEVPRLRFHGQPAAIAVQQLQATTARRHQQREQVDVFVCGAAHGTRRHTRAHRRIVDNAQNRIAGNAAGGEPARG